MQARVEHSNKFSSEVILGNNQAFGWPTQRERDITKRGELLGTILKSFTHTGHHINLGNEYALADSAEPAKPFDFKALIILFISRAMRLAK